MPILVEYEKLGPGLGIAMLNSTKHRIYPAHKCLNANNCLDFLLRNVLA